MKKVNVKKLNQFFMNGGNSEELKDLVKTAVDNFVHAEVKNPMCISILNDLGLLMEG
jgi:hypothetical protein